MLQQYDIQALVVDDMAAMRSMMRTQLQSIGVGSVKEASNASGALEKLREGAFNLCVIDYYLGDATDGQQLLDYLRSERLVPSSAVICMVTAESRYGAVAKVAEHSPDAYLIKPFTAEKLAETLRPIFERKFGIRRPNQSSPGLKPLYDQFDAGNYRAVVALADALTKKEGVRPDSARLKGEALLALGDIADALAHFEGIANSYAWAALGVAKAQTILHDTKRSIQVLEKLVEAAPLYVRATDLLAEAYIRDAQKEKALPLLEEACKKSPTVCRMRLTAQIAERLGESEVAANWAEKTISGNKHALVKDAVDYARHVRNLVKTGKVDKAIAALSAYEKDVPSLKTEGAMMAARAITLSAYITEETARFGGLSGSIRERRMALLEESRTRRDGLLDQLRAKPGEGQAAVYAAEAMVVAGDIEAGSDLAARMASAGAFLPQDMPERQAAIAHLLEHYEGQYQNGLKMIEVGRLGEAMRHLMALSEEAPVSMAPLILANVVRAAVSLSAQKDSIEDELPLAKAAYQRLKRQYPNYEGLDAAEKGLGSLLK
jgi:CheY-like chemotaxis protein